MGLEFLAGVEDKVCVWSGLNGGLLCVVHCDTAVMITRQQVLSSAVRKNGGKVVLLIEIKEIYLYNNAHMYLLMKNSRKI